MRGYCREENREVAAGFGPSAFVNLGREIDRGELRAGFFDNRKVVSSVSDTNIRPAHVNAIEADQIVIVHRKADSGAIGGKLGVCDPGKRMNDRDVEVRKIQDRLPHRYISGQRGKIDAELAYRSSEFIDVGELKRLEGRRRCDGNRAHSYDF
jgi:hypothetical protein